MTIEELEELTETARIERLEYQLALENLLTLRQLENGAVIRYEVTFRFKKLIESDMDY